MVRRHKVYIVQRQFHHHRHHHSRLAGRWTCARASRH
jgi:hypothetical protein